MNRVALLVLMLTFALTRGFRHLPLRRLRLSPRHLSTSFSDSDKIFEELSSLASEIRCHDELYYLSQPVITDAEFDSLVRREQELCTRHPDLLSALEAESPLKKLTTRFGGRVGPILPSQTSSSSLRVTHLAPLLSLENAMSEKDAGKWLDRMFKLSNSTSLKVRSCED